MGVIRNISLQSQSDEELGSAVKNTGNQEYVAALYQRYMDLIYGVCLKYLKHPQNAQDSSVSIYEELTIKLPRHHVEHFKAWLYTLAKNHCLMRLRSEKKTVTVEFDADLMQSSENVHLNGELEKEENLKKLEDCIGRLPADQKKTIELFYLEGKCYNEISATTGMEWNQVRSFIQNGRRNLKICMEKQNEKLKTGNEGIIRK